MQVFVFRSTSHTAKTILTCDFIIPCRAMPSHVPCHATRYTTRHVTPCQADMSDATVWDLSRVPSWDWSRDGHPTAALPLTSRLKVTCCWQLCDWTPGCALFTGWPCNRSAATQEISLRCMHRTELPCGSSLCPRRDAQTASGVSSLGASISFPFDMNHFIGCNAHCAYVCVACKA
jgi:hypothetical protein